MNPKSLIVIGAGPGGYVAALEAAGRGLSVTLIEKAELGGTCMNRGCIPSKYLLAKSKQLYDALNLSESGITVRLGPIDMTQLWARKDEILRTLRQREEQALKAARVRVLPGKARFVSPHQMEVACADGTSEVVDADAILLATGSSIQMPPVFPSHSGIVNSTSIFELPYLPTHLVVVGGGYIGCEMACAFHGLGSRITLIEKEPRLLPAQPEFEAAGALYSRSFEKRGMTLWTGTTVTAVKPLEDKKIQLTCSNGETVDANAVLVAVGRSPNVQDLALENAGLALDRNRLTVSAQMQTSVPHIYAIGDLVSPLPLAHTASWEAAIAIGAMLGEKEALIYSTVPRCIYAWPEAAFVGLSEEEARRGGNTPRIDRYHFAGNSKAMVEGDPEGFWVSISDADSRKILGGLIVGPHATELIHLVALAIKTGLKTTDIEKTIFAHPSLAESFRDVAVRALAPGKKQPRP